MKENIIKEIYKNTINTILYNIPEYLKQEFANSYFKYLVDIYLDDDLEESDIVIFTELEISKWKLASLDLKLSEILEDKSYDTIKSVSSNGNELAKRRLNDNSNNKPVIDLNAALNNVKLLEENLPNVREFNSQRAKQLVSEGIMDFYYASGQTNNTSLRNSRNR